MCTLAHVETLAVAAQLLPMGRPVLMATLLVRRGRCQKLAMAPLQTTMRRTSGLPGQHPSIDLECKRIDCTCSCNCSGSCCSLLLWALAPAACCKVRQAAMFSATSAARKHCYVKFFAWRSQN